MAQQAEVLAVGAKVWLVNPYEAATLPLVEGSAVIDAEDAVSPQPLTRGGGWTVCALGLTSAR